MRISLLHNAKISNENPIGPLLQTVPVEDHERSAWIYSLEILNILLKDNRESNNLLLQNFYFFTIPI